ncbi:MAG: fibronectin type III domain-containing protein [Patescibacteria group bacterium]|nr:fibronectin type III domain-containing protein [Patescibacteria group bacterium]
MKNSRLVRKMAAVFLGLIILGGLIILTFRVFGTRAADFEPRDVVVSNIEKNSARITWSTGAETQGIIEYGTSPTALNFFAPEPTREKNHSVDLTLLSPGTTYYFIIRINEKRYDNGGVPWSFTTKSAQESNVETGSSLVTPKIDPPGVDSRNNSSTPTPIQRLRIDQNNSENNNSQTSPGNNSAENSQISPTTTPTMASTQQETQGCPYKKCEDIRANLGKGCSTRDYWQCLLILTATPTPNSDQI